MELDAESMLILQTDLAAMREADAIEYLALKGIQLSPTEYKKIILGIKKESRSRLHKIGQDYAVNHLEHIDKLLAVEQELWALFRAKKQIIKTVKRENMKEIAGRIVKETVQDTEIIAVDQDPVERAKILHEIREIQRYISSYREHTKSILEESTIKFGQEKNIDVSEYLVANEPDKCLPEPRETEG